MKAELTYLVWVTTLTALMWIPYILDRIFVWGLMDTVGYPENPKPQSPWARRMKGAPQRGRESSDLRCVGARGSGGWNQQ